ncbi:5-dehydro-4-deoxyglucarate dehydratase [Solicola gregarius]|uniref:Probable 5-dehydro-4-deoxyglucarate dehydratase n=1 Tax=Solicola gregarius TaxID=2908642 RepID=A0AA46TJW3_9ACTN|nr:5-dehydro-4-deoxyglucarate dehydratase [Solicola gregarius]UYM06229.1 5-dehydro-4-deoxyglucarate dehydratase [Solicola gregarius]
MPSWTPSELASQIGSGLLSFPVTHFTDDLAFDEPAYREHLEWLSGYPVAALFAAGGTGEGFSLTAAEVAHVVRVAASGVGDTIPVIGSAMGGTRQAVELAGQAEEAGADGVLLMPPYLVDATQSGLVEHIGAVCSATSLGVVVYNRANAIIGADALSEACARYPNLVAFKDGVGDIEQLARIYARLGDRLTYVGGLPTAEVFALPLLQLGMTTYSSAMFNFVPGFALRFYAAVRREDRAQVYELLEKFVIPYTRIRDRRRGYAVSIVKAGMRVVGRPAGPVRPPLTDLCDEERDELEGLIARMPSE